jgi:aminoglycoside phosphotransferase (APT) family kinase protein
MIPQAMIPQEKSAAVTRGLHEAFGVTEFEDIRRITKGRSPGILVFRIVVQGRPFLLRIITRTDSLGPARHFLCMQAAAEAGLAPRVRYTNIEDQISIIDFVQEVPFPQTEALVRMPAALRKVHALPPFPGAEDHLNTTCMFLMGKGAAVDGFIQTIQAANIFTASEKEELFARYGEVAAVYPRHDGEMVSSHNDLFKPDNILFDGQRVWLVDWEAAFLNDRYADLAAVANLVVTNKEEAAVYLQEYFGQPPEERQLARFFLMQQIVHMFYAMVFLLTGSMGEPGNCSENTPDFREFHRRFWAGEVDLTDKDTKAVYGRVHLNQLLQNTQTARFREALRIVSDRAAREVI